MAIITLKPITRIILQTANGYYSLPWDGTAAVRIGPGEGIGTASHGDNIYSLVAADPTVAGTAPPASADQPYNPDAGALT